MMSSAIAKTTNSLHPVQGITGIMLGFTVKAIKRPQWGLRGGLYRNYGGFMDRAVDVP